jgi:putative copper export protein
MLIAHIVVHWVHVFGAVIWFGAYLMTALVITPANRSLAPETVTAVGEAAIPRAKRVILPAILATGIGGILLGTVFGPISSLDALFATPYGWTFLAAVAFGLLAFYPSKPAWLIRLRADAVGFFGAFTCMILMHFGL